MRIGELAALVGVSARAVRHYHQIGLLPEPRRHGNGYRDYGWRDAVQLARIRRLTAFGLSLDEVREALAEGAGGDVHAALTGLDADLARQEEDIRARRARLAVLLEQARAGTLPEEGPLSPQLTELFARLEPAPGSVEQPEGGMAARDREALALLDTAAPPDVRERMAELLGTLGASPREVERVRAAYALLDGLVRVAPDDPEVEAVVGELVDGVSDEMLGRMARAGAGTDFAVTDSVFVEALGTSLAPAQAEALRRAMCRIIERVERLS
ncbi:MerR family transcriptional regulator [Streptomyces oceani]|uniref:HTH merR-type domain-containing protein n=1 Tax=Streptomyces oceani TaxID=1075402 RepID=A0A1E7KNP8_9ACTN|nr:MerR family transcriptional regulator [Streptomyces oceani]OEV05602.1 hypothetical protein AN216_02805 [Streptomyces oceani]